MADDNNGNIKVEESVIAEEEKKSGECLKDSVRFEDFAAQTENTAETGRTETTGKGEVLPSSVPAEEYEKVKRELSETVELLRRVAADFENYKKRVIREKEDLLKFANESILRDMLETADNLELTLFHAKEKSVKNDDLVKGFEITVKGFLEFMKRYGVTQLDITANETMFDPNFHEAIGVQESETAPSGQIIKVERKGYMLKDRLLRPALVVVSKGKLSDEGKKKAEESEEREPSEMHKCIAEPEPENKDE